ncbi:hypothetical protein Pelo_400 [Pelomyxa schiedti]|nr:hypothetical protein Pelo_400 [Pelomyxa schiedti]
MGLSATLGVVWCKCLDQAACALLDCEVDTIQGCVGDDRFVAVSSSGAANVIDSEGNVVAPLDGGSEMAPFGLWVNNCKWLVRIEDGGEDEEGSTNLKIWRMRDGAPLSGGERSCVPLSVDCAGFSQFEPFGDCLVLAGFSGEEDEDDAQRPGILYSIDLEKFNTTAAGRNTAVLQHPVAFGLVWASPNTILTLHGDSTKGYKVYNTVTGQLHAFPSSKYQEMYSVSSCGVPAHLVSSLRGSETCEYQHTAATGKIEVCSSSNAIYAVPTSSNTAKPPLQQQEQHLTTLYIHDSTTGIPLTTLEVILMHYTL